MATRQHTFSDVATGAVGLVVDSCGMLALVLDQRSAAMDLGHRRRRSDHAGATDRCCRPTATTSPVSACVPARLPARLSGYAPGDHAHVGPPVDRSSSRPASSRCFVCSARTAVNLAHIIDGHPPEHVAIISRGVETTYGNCATTLPRFAVDWPSSASAAATASRCCAATACTSSRSTLRRWGSAPSSYR